MPTPPPDSRTLSLFEGPHLATFRFEEALARLDLEAALPDAPEAWRAEVAELAAALGGHAPGRAELSRLLAVRGPVRPAAWPDWLETLWQRLVGLRLDGRGIPGVLEGEPAAAFLLRGKEPARAHSSAQHHLARHPADAQAWAVLAELGEEVAAVRCAWHGGGCAHLPAELVERVEEDEHEDLAAWSLALGWLGRWLQTSDLEAALAATGSLGTRPLPIEEDGRAFACYLLWAEQDRLSGGGPNPQVVENRRRLNRISHLSFQRYLRSVRSVRG